MVMTFAATAGANRWQVIPINPLAGIVLLVLFIYLIFRHFLFVLMVADLLIGWVRRFTWFPKEGKRRKTLVHWIVAWAMFVGFLAVSGVLGLLQFVPN